MSISKELQSIDDSFYELRFEIFNLTVENDELAKKKDKLTEEVEALTADCDVWKKSYKLVEGMYFDAMDKITASGDRKAQVASDRFGGSHETQDYDGDESDKTSSGPEARDPDLEEEQTDMTEPANDKDGADFSEPDYEDKPADDAESEHHGFADDLENDDGIDEVWNLVDRVETVLLIARMVVIVWILILILSLLIGFFVCAFAECLSEEASRCRTPRPPSRISGSVELSKEMQLSRRGRSCGQ